MSGPAWRGPQTWLLASAVGRLRRTHADWAEAMLAEASLCAEPDRLRWAWGCWVASLRMSSGATGLAYCAALAAGLAAMAAYEWSADESRETVAVLALIAASLGVLRPRQALLSGILVGLVVTGVIGFEAVSGIRPAYEARAQTLLHSLRWTILLVPSLLSAALGARLRRRLRSAGPPP